jgi:hypothetical protein
MKNKRHKGNLPVVLQTVLVMHISHPLVPRTRLTTPLTPETSTNESARTQSAHQLAVVKSEKERAEGQAAQVPQLQQQSQQQLAEATGKLTAELTVLLLVTFLNPLLSLHTVG